MDSCNPTAWRSQKDWSNTAPVELLLKTLQMIGYLPKSQACSPTKVTSNGTRKSASSLSRFAKTSSMEDDNRRALSTKNKMVLPSIVWASDVRSSGRPYKRSSQYLLRNLTGSGTSRLISKIIWTS